MFQTDPVSFIYRKTDTRTDYNLDSIFKLVLIGNWKTNQYIS